MLDSSDEDEVNEGASSSKETTMGTKKGKPKTSKKAKKMKNDK